jgi:5-oxoprolinase (ATP-hydrolysing)
MQHMTNTRITDPEILERRYPVVLHEFSIRQGSGGEGEFKGGDGLVREMEFLEPIEISMLSERRVKAPYGMAGGQEGALGKNTLRRKVGDSFREINFGGKNSAMVQPGDRFQILTLRFKIETPGAGGWGEPSKIASVKSQLSPMDVKLAGGSLLNYTSTQLTG